VRGRRPGSARSLPPLHGAPPRRGRARRARPRASRRAPAPPRPACPRASAPDARSGHQRRGSHPLSLISYLLSLRGGMKKKRRKLGRRRTSKSARLSFTPRASATCAHPKGPRGSDRTVGRGRSTPPGSQLSSSIFYLLSSISCLPGGGRGTRQGRACSSAAILSRCARAAPASAAPARRVRSRAASPRTCSAWRCSADRTCCKAATCTHRCASRAPPGGVCARM
jgi:hypothetical protein